LQAQGWAVSVVCGACGAQLDATDDNLKVLQYGERVTAKPRIPLGTRGTWKGAPWDVIGFQVVTITVEGTDYSWTEYVCFNPYRGFLYLSEYQGHWNVIEKLRRRVGATMQVLVDSAPALGRRGGVGRTYADAPEIDGSVQLLPPEKISKTLKVGEFTQARVVGTRGHDLVAVPF
jgi:hypothetical protein